MRYISKVLNVGLGFFGGGCGENVGDKGGTAVADFLSRIEVLGQRFFLETLFDGSETVCRWLVRVEVMSGGRALCRQSDHGA